LFTATDIELANLTAKEVGKLNEEGKCLMLWAVL
jgi:hypothetical protein